MIEERPRDEFELWQEARERFGWMFALTREQFCSTCGPRVAAERLAALNADNSARDTAEAGSGALSEQRRML